MKRPYYLFSNGRLRRKQNTLFLERADAERTPDDVPDDTGGPSGTPTGDRVPFPVEQVEAIYVFGELDINTKLVTFLAQHGPEESNYLVNPAHPDSIRVQLRGQTPFEFDPRLPRSRAGG